jgi:PAS domain S-box-containing protein
MYEMLLEHSPLGFAFVDCELRFVQVSAKLAAIDGQSREAHVGRKVAELLPGVPRMIEVLRDVLSHGRAVEDVELSGRTRASLERPLSLTASFHAVRGRGGRTLGVAMLVEDVTVRRALEAQNELLRQRTHLAAQIRSEVVALARRELRAPLATIASTIDQVSRKFPVADRWKQTRVLLDTMRRSVERIEVLGRELDDLGSLQSGSFPVDVREHDVVLLASDSVKRLYPLPGERVLRLEADVETGLTVACDRDRIHQVISFAVNHLCRSTPEGGVVTLRIEAHGSSVRFVARAGGQRALGMSAQDEERDVVALRLASEIVRAHGGTLAVDATHDGKSAIAIGLARGA